MLESSSLDRSRDFIPLLTTCCLITFGLYLATAMRLPIMPLHAKSFGITTVQIGIINSVFYLMAGCLSLPSGFLSQRIGGKRLVIIGLIIMAIATFLLFFSRSFMQLTGLYLLLGIGVAAFGPTMMSLVAQIAPATHLGRAYGWYTTALFCGLSLGPGVAGVMGEWMNLQTVFIVASALVVVTLWSVIVFLPIDSFDQGKKHQGQSGLLSGAKILAGNTPFLGCLLITFGANLVAGMFFTFLPLHALGQGISVSQIGIIFLVQAFTNAFIRIPFGALSDRVSQRKYLVVGGIACVAISITGFGSAQVFYQFIIAGVGLGFGMALAFTSIGALIAETVDDNLRGPAMGGYNACLYFGMMAGSVVFGPVIEAIGYVRSFMLNGSLNMAIVLLFLMMMRTFLPPQKEIKVAS